MRSSPGPKTGCSPGGGGVCARADRVAILTRSEDRVQPSPQAKIVVRRRRLRSSPGPKTGCSFRSPPGGDSPPRVAILTRSEDRVQLRIVGLIPHVIRLLRSSPGPKTGCSVQISPWGGFPPQVAILTRSEDRVQQPSPHRRPARRRRCDPHPVRRPGAAAFRVGRARGMSELRSSPGPKTGCSLQPSTETTHDLDVAILTRSEDRVQRVVPVLTYRPPRVAILTRSEDRVQPPSVGERELPKQPVAILTRSEDRVQPGAVRAVLPGPALVAILTRSEDRVQHRPRSAAKRPARRCDPHPVRRPGAALVVEDPSIARIALRSSPGPKTGCSHQPAVIARRHPPVAILTRSEDRVQPDIFPGQTV